MKTEFLQNFKVGDQPLPKEVIDAILAENGRDIEAIKTERDNLKTQLQTAKDGLKAFEGVDVKDLQSQITQLQQDLADKDTAHQAELANMAFDRKIEDAITAAKARGCDVVICDTAGRLHNKQNLMNELEKMRRVINRELPEASVETLLVLDATTGQNAISQAEGFNSVTGLTGLVITKLDGTAKGGIAIHVSSSMQVPVKYIGVGEQVDDLLEFDALDFTRAFFDNKEGE